MIITQSDKLTKQAETSSSQVKSTNHYGFNWSVIPMALGVIAAATIVAVSILMSQNLQVFLGVGLMFTSLLGVYLAASKKPATQDDAKLLESIKSLEEQKSSLNKEVEEQKSVLEKLRAAGQKVLATIADKKKTEDNTNTNKGQRGRLDSKSGSLSRDSSAERSVTFASPVATVQTSMSSKSSLTTKTSSNNSSSSSSKPSNNANDSSKKNE
jgi:hypothetical protein